MSAQYTYRWNPLTGAAFKCDHCRYSVKITGRKAMDDHIREKHPEFWSITKLEWTHAAVGEFNGKLTPRNQTETTECGKTARRIQATFNNDAVTCPLCLEKLKEDNWHCPTHGFIHDMNVTYYEKCDMCGESVAD